MKRIFHFVGHAVLAIAAIVAFGAVVMLLWNWLMPDIFGLPTVTLWQALGLLVLARLFFSGMGRFRGAGMMRRDNYNHVRERWTKMTDEERKVFMNSRRFKLMKDRRFGHMFGRDFHDFHDFFNADNADKPE